MDLQLDNERILRRMRRQSVLLQRPEERAKRAMIPAEKKRRLADVLAELAQELVLLLPWWAKLGLRASGADVEELVAKALRWIEGIIIDIIDEQRNG